MTKIQIGNMVKVKAQKFDPWNNQRGVIVAEVWEGNRKRYIVQFSKPVDWSWFSKKEIKWDE